MVKNDFCYRGLGKRHQQFLRLGMAVMSKHRQQGSFRLVFSSARQPPPKHRYHRLRVFKRGRLEAVMRLTIAFVLIGAKQRAYTDRKPKTLERLGVDLTYLNLKTMPAMSTRHC